MQSLHVKQRDSYPYENYFQCEHEKKNNGSRIIYIGVNYFFFHNIYTVFSRNAMTGA